MWVEDPYCRYCGVETILANGGNVKKGEKTPPHIATIDHKYSRYNPDRDVVKQEYILCCSLCNNYRAQLEEDKIPIEELRRRSQMPSYRTRQKPAQADEINPVEVC